MRTLLPGVLFSSPRRVRRAGTRFRVAGQPRHQVGDPGHADVIIPGTPGTPAIGDLPGTPGTPPLIIPGTPDAPGYWFACR